MSKSVNDHDYSAVMDLSVPLDYSFKKLKDLQALKSDRPKEGRLGKTPPRGSSKRFITKAVWLNSNYIGTMVGFDKFIRSVLDIPESLSWIDLSFNRIKIIDESVTQFPNITIMYLHGNRIEDLETVTVLRKMGKLKRLTLHGNPISQENGYRACVTHLVPQIANLDFVPISKEDRNCPPPPGSYKKFGHILNSTN